MAADSPTGPLWASAQRAWPQLPPARLMLLLRMYLLWGACGHSSASRLDQQRFKRISCILPTADRSAAALIYGAIYADHALMSLYFEQLAEQESVLCDWAAASRQAKSLYAARMSFFSQLPDEASQRCALCDQRCGGALAPPQTGDFE